MIERLLNGGFVKPHRVVIGTFTDFEPAVAERGQSMWFEMPMNDSLAVMVVRVSGVRVSRSEVQAKRQNRRQKDPDRDAMKPSHESVIMVWRWDLVK